MRIIARSTLIRFGESLQRHRDHDAVVAALAAWFHEVRRHSWATPADVKASYASASFVGGHRVVFNVKGNDYRLVVDIDYAFRAVFIKWIGSHKEYDRIDVRTVEYAD